MNGTTRIRVDLGALHLNEAVKTLLVLGVLLALVRLLLQAVLSTLPARIAADAQARLRCELFASFTHASWALQSRDREGHVQELMTNHVREATVGILQATALMTATLTFLVLVASAFALDVTAAFIVLATAAGLFLLLRPLSSLGRRSAQALSRAYMNYAGGVSEATRLAEENNVFGVADAQYRNIESLILAARRNFLRTQQLALLAPGVYQSLIYLFVVLGLAGLYAAGAGHVASLGAVILLLVRAGSYGQQAQGAYQLVGQSAPYLRRLADAQRSYRTSHPPKVQRPLEPLRTLAFENVSFAYQPDRPVLSHVSFQVTPGEAIGIIGPSGAGKSTLVQILLALRTPDTGRFLVNDIPAHEYAHTDWCKHVAYVPQAPRLLHAPVTDNIRYFRDVDDAAVQQAAHLAGIHDEILSWPHGYDTVVGPRADAVSGGQQQRICLARALAARPEVLVLDEPTSALDPHSQRRIAQSLESLKHELTLFIVAHNMATLALCDRVMVIVGGRVEAFTAEHALDATSPYYRTAMAISSTPPSESVAR